MISECSIEKKLCLGNVWDVFYIADLHSSEHLKVACSKLIQQNASKILFNEEFRSIKESDNSYLWNELQRYVSDLEEEK